MNSGKFSWFANFTSTAKGRPSGRPTSAGALAATGKLVADQAQRGTGTGEIR